MPICCVDEEMFEEDLHREESEKREEDWIQMGDLVGEPCSPSAACHLLLVPSCLRESLWHRELALRVHGGGWLYVSISGVMMPHVQGAEYSIADVREIEGEAPEGVATTLLTFTPGPSL